MGNILTYLKWRGDLAFHDRPFCEVDNLVLACISNLDFSGIVPEIGSGGGITLREAEDLYNERAGEEPGVLDGISKQFISACAGTYRYRKVNLRDYVKFREKGSGLEFSALCFDLGDGSTFISFKGAGETLDDWKEEFLMSYRENAALRMAAEYVRQIAIPGGMYRIGGNAKGGTLAVYAAMKNAAQARDRIIEVWNDGGPGLSTELIDYQAYESIRSRIRHIVPEYDVIGALFETEPPFCVVKSSANGIMQHDSLTWQVEGDSFLSVETVSATDTTSDAGKCVMKRSRECDTINKVLYEWLEKATIEERDTLVTTLFGTLEKNGYRIPADLGRDGMNAFEMILLAIVSKESRWKLVTMRVFRTLSDTFGAVDLSEFVKSAEMRRGLFIFIAGILFAVAPSVAPIIVAVFVGIWAVINIGRELFAAAFDDSKDKETRRTRMIIHIALIAGISYIAAHRGLVVQIVNLGIALLFFYFAYRWFRNALTKTGMLHERLLRAVLGGVCFGFGIVPIVASHVSFGRFTLAEGIVLIIYGFALMLIYMYQQGKANAAKRVDGPENITWVWLINNKKRVELKAAREEMMGESKAASARDNGIKEPPVPAGPDSEPDSELYYDPEPEPDEEGGDEARTLIDAVNESYGEPLE